MTYTGEQMAYSWMIEGPEATLDSSQYARRLYIQPNTLQAGEMYTLILTASLLSDPTLTASDR